MKSEDFKKGLSAVGFAKQTQPLGLIQNFSSLINRSMQKSYFTKIWSWIVIAFTVMSFSVSYAQMTVTISNVLKQLPLEVLRMVHLSLMLLEEQVLIQ
jgi:hypothetical protein